MRLVVIPALIAALAVAALAPAASSAPPTFKYPSDVRSEFVRGCVSGGGSKAACKCVIKKIERRYSFKQFARIIRRVNAGAEFPRPIQRFIQGCSSLQ